MLLAQQMFIGKMKRYLNLEEKGLTWLKFLIDNHHRHYLAIPFNILFKSSKTWIHLQFILLSLINNSVSTFSTGDILPICKQTCGQDKKFLYNSLL